MSAEFTIYVGNKNYSSWSMRGWLAMAQVGVPFDEVVIRLDVPETKDEIAKVNPAGRVPFLKHGDRVIWDSLAICEYLGETFPQAGLWPSDAGARAKARSLSAEMHAGFSALRTNMPMNIRAEKRGKGMAEGVAEDIARIRAIWAEKQGPFLFGAFGNADIMFAPVVTRFRTYGVTVEGHEVAYAQAVWDHPMVQRWVAAAKAEPWSIPHYD